MAVSSRAEQKRRLTVFFSFFFLFGWSDQNEGGKGRSQRTFSRRGYKEVVVVSRFFKEGEGVVF